MFNSGLQKDTFVSCNSYCVIIIIIIIIFCYILCVVIDSFCIGKRSCAALYKSGERISGVYTINPDDGDPFDVYCDQKTAGGGWTVIQKRFDGSVDFYRGWTDYKNGFGNQSGEFWLGLDKIYRLTKRVNRIRVELEDTKGNTAYADYDLFWIENECAKYKLHLGSYSGQ